MARTIYKQDDVERRDDGTYGIRIDGMFWTQEALLQEMSNPESALDKVKVASALSTLFGKASKDAKEEEKDAKARAEYEEFLRSCNAVLSPILTGLRPLLDALLQDEDTQDVDILCRSGRLQIDLTGRVDQKDLDAASARLKNGRVSLRRGEGGAWTPTLPSGKRSEMSARLRGVYVTDTGRIFKAVVQDEGAKTCTILDSGETRQDQTMDGTQGPLSQEEIGIEDWPTESVPALSFIMDVWDPSDLGLEFEKWLDVEDSQGRTVGTRGFRPFSYPMEVIEKHSYPLDDEAHTYEEEKRNS